MRDRRAFPLAALPGLLALALLLGLAGLPPSASGSRAGFSASVRAVSAAELGSSYRPGCPVSPAELRLVRLSYIGFDGRAHRGAIVVNLAAVSAVERVFSLLYAERFPIREMEPIARYAGNDNRSMAADNTSGYNCRYAVSAGAKQWSEHAYGEAIDVNPLENPYVFGGNVLPPAGRRYVDRTRVRPGMAVRGGQLVAAFASVGWQWGGRWSGSPDYQHFSANGG
jgi:hypothetical protein